MLYVIPQYGYELDGPTGLAGGLRVVEVQAKARRFYEREGWRLDEQLASAHNGFFPLVYYRRDLTS